MGKIIEGFLIERGHSISFKIDKENFHQLKDINRENTDVCIEFTGPNSAKANLEILVGNGMPVYVVLPGGTPNLHLYKSLR